MQFIPLSSKYDTVNASELFIRARGLDHALWALSNTDQGPGRHNEGMLDNLYDQPLCDLANKWYETWVFLHNMLAKDEPGYQPMSTDLRMDYDALGVWVRTRMGDEAPNLPEPNEGFAIVIEGRIAFEWGYAQSLAIVMRPSIFSSAQEAMEWATGPEAGQSDAAAKAKMMARIQARKQKQES